MLIAVTSSDGIEINQHFGHADRFLIYEVGDGSLQLAGEIAADAYCNWGVRLQDLPPEQFAATLDEMRECAETAPTHRMMPEKIAAIARALGDCRTIVTAMIGETPQAELERLGFTTFSLKGRIDQILPELAKVL